MKHVIFYFSGTGNSYYVAKRIANSSHGKLLHISEALKLSELDYERIGFVFPIYDFKPPEYIEECIQQIEMKQDATIYCVCTYGVSMSGALQKFERMLAEKNMKLSLGYGVHMPHNAVGSKWLSEQHYMVALEKSEAKIDEIIGGIVKGEEGYIEKGAIIDKLTLVRLLPRTIAFLLKLMWYGTAAFEFQVDDKCISCRQCVRICPVNNIRLDKGLLKPVFGDKCTSCFACIQWCPQEAIHVGKYDFDELGIRRYHHPKVEVQEMIRRG